MQIRNALYGAGNAAASTAHLQGEAVGRLDWYVEFMGNRISGMDVSLGEFGAECAAAQNQAASLNEGAATYMRLAHGVLGLAMSSVPGEAVRGRLEAVISRLTGNQNRLAELSNFDSIKAAIEGVKVQLELRRQAAAGARDGASALQTALIDTAQAAEREADNFK